MRRLATEAGEGPVVATIERNGGSAGFADALGAYGTFATWMTLAALAVSLIARWQAVDHAPWSNMYEFTIAFAAGITAFYVVFERFYVDEERARSARVLGALAHACCVRDARDDGGVLPLGRAAAGAGAAEHGPAGDSRGVDGPGVRCAERVVRGGGAVPGAGRKRNRFARLPSAETLDDIAYRSVMLGFPMLALGIALGAYWANSAWGRYWGWDPKETSALVTWLIYGIYLHMRGLRNWSGTRSAIVLVAGFAAVMFTYFAVNLWVSGLHSYAGV